MLDWQTCPILQPNFITKVSHHPVSMMLRPADNKELLLENSPQTVIWFCGVKLGCETAKGTILAHCLVAVCNLQVSH